MIRVPAGKRRFSDFPVLDKRPFFRHTPYRLVGIMKTDTEPSTKDKLLNAAEALMLAKGFTATSVDEICEEAGVTKGSFFHYFESKDELARVVLERFCCNMGSVHASCCSGEKDPLKRLYAYVDGMIRHSKEKGKEGCLLGMFSQELAQEDAAMRRLCDKAFDGWRSQLTKEIAEAKRAHAPKAAFDPQSVADHLIAVVEGSWILAKVRQNPAIVAANLKHFRDYLEGLFSQ